MNFIKIFYIVFFFLSNSVCLAEVNFVHITDPHIFEAPGKNKEAKLSLKDFANLVNKINKLQDKKLLDFILLTGDFGIEKLVAKKMIDNTNETEKNNALIIKEDGKLYKLQKDNSKWQKAITDVANIISKSDVKLWLLVPGNNDLVDEIPNTINFYADFIADLKYTKQIKESAIKLLDFRLESSDTIDNLPPGVMVIGQNSFVGWDNSYFKNNYSIKSFLDENNQPKPLAELTEYKSLQKLDNVINDIKTKSAFIFYHIPEVDDPWRVNFSLDPEDDNDNTVLKTLREIKKFIPKMAEDFYPYSAWTVPTEIRKMWEAIVTNTSYNTKIKGLFAGHFHDHNKSHYKNFDWLKETRYKPEIINKMYIAPSISIKNQTDHQPKNRARGGQIVNIDAEGNVKIKHFWIKN